MTDNDKIAVIAHALSDPIRLAMIAMLRGQADVCACEFQAQLALSQSKASYHLKILVDAGLITRTIRGTWSHYSLADKPAVADLWTAFRRLAEDGAD